MAIEWPQHLVERIAAGQWVLFVGSGLSASSRNTAGDSPLTWTGLLTELCSRVTDSDLKQAGDDLIAEHQLLAAADHIRYCLDNQNALNTYHAALKRAVEGPPGDLFVPSELFDRLLALDPRIVFTTNYDKL